MADNPAKTEATALQGLIVGGVLTVRVTPKAARNRLVIDGESARVYVTTVPEGGKATAAVVKLLAKELGIAKSRITLLRGAKDRTKLFQIKD